MIPALRGKQIDAFVAWEPYPAKAVTSGAGEIILSSKEIWPRHPCCVLAADSRFVDANPDAVQRLLKAHVKATNYIQNNFQEAASIGAKYTGMDLDTVKLAMKNTGYQYELDVHGELEYVEFLKELQAIKVENPGWFVNQFIDQGRLREALQGK